MTLTEAIGKMQVAVTAAMDRLEGNGFVMSVETDYMDRAFRSVSVPERAKCVTVSLVINTRDGQAGEEYCMSLGAMVSGKNVDEVQLDKDIEGFGKMVDEAIDTLAYYDDKDEGLRFLTAKAAEEYEKFVKEMEEGQRKGRRLAMITNIVFILGITLLFILALLR